MRLIYHLLFLFSSFGAILVKAGPVLDLDTYDPEEFNLVLNSNPSYKEEVFTPKSNDQITQVTASGVELFTPEGGSTVSKVNVYSVSSVPQLVQVHLNNESYTENYQKQGNQYQKVTVNQFNQVLQRIKDHAFSADLQFGLNIQTKFTPRNLFTMQEKPVDGVKTYVFTPTGLPQITSVTDGPSPIRDASQGEHFTRITVSSSKGNMVLASLEATRDGNPSVYYYHKTHSWNLVDQTEYNNLLNQLHPVDVTRNVTLDVSQPNESEFHIEKDFDQGLTETSYSPHTGFELTKVTYENTELWTSNVNRSSKVVVYTVGNTVELVKVELKGTDGQTTSVNLVNAHGYFNTASEKEFSDRLQQIKTQLASHRTPGKQPTHVTLDVANPDHNVFAVNNRTFKGVHYKEFYRKDGHAIPKVESSGDTIYESSGGESVTHVNVFLSNGVPTFYQVSGYDSKSEQFNVLLSWDQGKASPVDTKQFQNFLKTAAKPPTLSHSLELNFEDPEQDNVAVYTSRVYGLDNTVAQAREGYYFRTVYYGSTMVWSTTNHQGVAVTQVVGFKNKVIANDQFQLLELEGFHNGNFVSYYFEKQGLSWNPVDQPTFQNKFRLLKFPDLGTEPSQKPVRRHSLPSLSFSPPEQPTTPEESETPQEPTPPEEPTLPEETTPPEQPETPPEPTVPEEPQEGPSTPLPPSQELEVVDLDTENIDDAKVSMVAGTEDGYYFKSYAPKNDVYFGKVTGPGGFEFDGRGSRLVTHVKFFWVHSKLVGGTLFTVSLSRKGQLEYYYTFENNEWEYTTNPSKLSELIANETAFTEQQKQDREYLRQTTEKLNLTLQKLKEKEEKELKRRREQEEKENKVVIPKKLSHKTRLYDEMADFEQHPPPKGPEPSEETEEELEKRRHPYAGGDKILVESELLYFELSRPKNNDFVHTKDYTCMGLPTVDVTPYSGKYLHVVSSNGKRVWVSSNTRRATNMQLFFVDDQIVGALLKVTSVVRGTTVTGEEFDYLFVKNGELQKVDVGDFLQSANMRFQTATLVNLSTAKVAA